RPKLSRIANRSRRGLPRPRQTAPDAVECPTHSERESNDPLHPRRDFTDDFHLHAHRSQPRATTARTHAAAATSSATKTRPCPTRNPENRGRSHGPRTSRKSPRRRNQRKQLRRLPNESPAIRKSAGQIPTRLHSGPSNRHRL